MHRETTTSRYPSFNISGSPLVTEVGSAPARGPRQNPRTPRHWATTYVRALALVDALIAVGAMLIGWWVSDNVNGRNEFGWEWMLLGAISWPLSVAVRRGYDASKVGVSNSELTSLPRALADHVVLSAFICVVSDSTSLLTAMVVATPIAVAVGILARLAFRRTLHRHQRAGKYLRSVLVIGPLGASKDLTNTLRQDPACGLDVIGACVPDNDLAADTDADLRVFGSINEVPDIVGRVGVEAVAVTGGLSPSYLRGLAWSLEGKGVDLLVSPGLVEVAGPRMHIRPFVGLPLLHVEHPHFTGWRRTIKRAFDISLTTLGLLAIAPVLLVLMVIIKISDRGPVFFTQTRVGLNGKTFKMIKFRSMVPNAEALKAQLMADNEGAGPLFKMKKDPRITKIGGLLRRYSIDELPQLFNVLRGDMSLVGPRPPLPSEVDQYGNDVRRRLLVQPGLTGLWQVSGRSSLSWDESVRLDLRYVENWAMSLDLLIIWKTAWAVVGKDGAY